MINHDTFTEKRDKLLLYPVIFLSKIKLTPNILSLTGVAVMGTFPLLFPAHKLLSALVVLISVLFDLLDGSLARYQNSATGFGRALDLVCDNINLYILSGTLVYHSYLNLPLGIGLIISAIVLAVIGTVGANYRAKKLGKKFSEIRGFWVLPNVIKGIFYVFMLAGFIGGAETAFSLSLLIMKIAWFTLPACAANLAPVFAKKINFLGQPIDAGLCINGKRLAGDHKTWRGLILGLFVAVVAIKGQALISPYLKECLIIDYSRNNILLVGFLFGFGALFGDFVKSIFKRQFGIPEGKSWPPFDQIDWVVGSMLFVNLYLDIDIAINIGSLILLPSLHPLFHYFGYLIGLNKDKV